MNSPIAQKPHKLLFILGVLGLVFWAFGLTSSQAVGLKTGKTSQASSRNENPDVFDMLLDMSLGLISQQEFTDKLETMKIRDFKAELENKLKDLKEDRVGVREVDAEIFSKLVASTKIVSSSQQVVPIGVSKDRAYLEYSLFLSSEYRYVAIVATDLTKLPDATATKLKSPQTP